MIMFLNFMAIIVTKPFKGISYSLFIEIFYVQPKI